MKRIILGLTFCLAACDGTYRIVSPWCPVSDSAWAHADSIPAICLTDTVSQKRKKP